MSRGACVFAAAVAELAVLAAACRCELSAGAAAAKRAKIRIRWTAQSSQDLYGFNVYRGQSPDGPWERVNPTPILAAEGGTTSVPHDYVCIDPGEDIVLGETYWYYLEAVENDGTKKKIWWPPKSVTARVAIDDEFPSAREK